MQLIVFLSTLLIFARGEEVIPSTAPIHSTPEPSICVYGVEDAKLGFLVGRTISLDIVCALAFVGVTLLGGSVLFLLFSLPGFAFAAAAGCIITDVIARRWQTWKYFGPGAAFVTGVTGNKVVFVTHTIRSALNKLLQLVGTIVLARYAFLVEENRIPRWLTTIRCTIGVLCALGMSAISSYYAFTKGVPSVYRGVDGDTLNAVACSGPASWPQLAGYVRFAMVLPFFAPLMYHNVVSYAGLPFSIAAIVCSSLTIGRQWNGYQQVGAVSNLISYIPALFVVLIERRQQRSTSTTTMEDEEAM